MSSKLVQWLALVLTVALLVTAAARYREAIAMDASAPSSQRGALHLPLPPSDSALDEAEDLTVTYDPFRLANSPPSARYDPSLEGAPVAARANVPVQIRPRLVLRAIVGGPPWQAVVDGIPGQPPGTLVSDASRYDKLLIRAITRDSVVIQGPDTSWVLTFARQP